MFILYNLHITKDVTLTFLALACPDLESAVILKNITPFLALPVLVFYVMTAQLVGELPGLEFYDFTWQSGEIFDIECVVVEFFEVL